MTISLLWWWTVSPDILTTEIDLPTVLFHYSISSTLSPTVWDTSKSIAGSRTRANDQQRTQKCQSDQRATSSKYRSHRIIPIIHTYIMYHSYLYVNDILQKCSCWFVPDSDDDATDDDSDKSKEELLHKVRDLQRKIRGVNAQNSRMKQIALRLRDSYEELKESEGYPLTEATGRKIIRIIEEAR